LRILLDECAPRIVKTRLARLAISTVQELGWTGIKNGELLARAEQRFDVLVTADQSFPYQQNLGGPSSRRGGAAEQQRARRRWAVTGSRARVGRDPAG